MAPSEPGATPRRMPAPKPETFPDRYERVPDLGKKLVPRLLRVFPTAHRIVLHPRLVLDSRGLRRAEETLTAYDTHGRVLAPLRVEESFDLLDDIHARHGAGMLVLNVPRPG